MNKVLVLIWAQELSAFAFHGGEKKKKEIKENAWLRQENALNEKSTVTRKGYENFEVKVYSIDWGYKSILHT